MDKTLKKIALLFTLILFFGLFYMGTNRWSSNSTKLNLNIEQHFPATNMETKTLDVRVFFGYKDSRPARFVADRYEKALFIKILMSPCSEHRWDCDFLPIKELKNNNSTTLFRRARSYGGIETQVLIQIFDSSAGPDDYENRRNPFQKWKSNFVENEFKKALVDAEIIFYNGHSRAGGGPDFSPPLLTKKDHVNYSYYQKRKQGLNLILDTLNENPSSKLKLISLHSCQSDQLFRQQIEFTKQGLKVNGSRELLYSSDALNESLKNLSQLIESFLS
jgi:hypothetical protein